MSNEKLLKELKGENDNKTIYHFFSPSRINLIGEHIDYVGGKVVPAAIKLGISAYVRKSDNIRVKSIDFSDDWKVIDAANYENFFYSKDDGFMNFVKGVFFELKDKLKNGQGFELILSSNIPSSSGLSSSAAFGMLVLDSLNTLYELKLSKKAMVKIFQKVENNFIGVNSGVMDQFAIAFGKKNNFILLDTFNLEFKYLVSNPVDYKFLLICSNKSRNLINSAYNIRYSELQEVARIIGKDFKTLASSATIDDIHKVKTDLLQRRLKHVISEAARVEIISKKLRHISGKELGKILNESHISLNMDYEVSCDELNFIHDSLNQINEFYGGRMIGAGFGGCFLGVVDRNFDIDKIDFLDEYKRIFGIKYDKYEIEIIDGIWHEEVK